MRIQMVCTIDLVLICAAIPSVDQLQIAKAKQKQHAGWLQTTFHLGKIQWFIMLVKAMSPNQFCACMRVTCVVSFKKFEVCMLSVRANSHHPTANSVVFWIFCSNANYLVLFERCSRRSKLSKFNEARIWTSSEITFSTESSHCFDI